MREIEFRGQSNKETKKWVYGLMTEKDFIRCFDENGNINATYRVLPDTIGQYAGIKDLNGKKIFEGDIFVPLYFPPCTTIEKVIQLHELDNDNIGVITFEYGNTILKKKYKRDKELSDYIEQEFSHYQSNVGEIYNYKNNIAIGEVIGNIYDNPELLR